MEGKSCHFPFVHEGDFKGYSKKFFKCTWANPFSRRNGRPWCATVNTDIYSDHVYLGSDWGECSDGCPAEGRHVRFIFSVSVKSGLLYYHNQRNPSAGQKTTLEEREGTTASSRLITMAKLTTPAPGPEHSPRETESHGVQPLWTFILTTWMMW